MGAMSTVADERAWRYTPVECAACHVVVQVAKFSLQHTSVQWTGNGVLGCAEFAAKVAAGGESAGGSGASPTRVNTALIPTCASLRDSIDDAVADGRVEVLPP
jgi:hypothetical protein